MEIIPPEGPLGMLEPKTRGLFSGFPLRPKDYERIGNPGYGNKVNSNRDSHF